ncbi:MAG: hypothetical protein M1813_000419 [Trichoglossum hirsutum]|nr:MAG: hypothetical protein M1813_000419 [Trichoglossum hirsutum]
MDGAQRLSYASALSRPPPGSSSRPIKRLPAVFSRRVRSSRSSRTPAEGPQIEEARIGPNPVSRDWKELESQSGGVKIQAQGFSRPIDSPMDPMPDHGVWKEMETEIEVFKSPTKRKSRFSGFFASSDYQKRHETTERLTKLKTPAESPEFLRGIFAWQGDRERLGKSTYNGDLVRSYTESSDPFHTRINGYEGPAILKLVTELVATPTESADYVRALFPPGSDSGSLVDGLNDGKDALRVVRVSTQFSIHPKDRPLNMRIHRHSGSMSSVDDGDSVHMPPYLTSAIPRNRSIQADSLGSPWR